ncbi:MAG: CoA pyrophosphatase [Pseudomonadota bacterium]
MHLAEIQANIQRFDPVRISKPELRKAAVSIVISYDRNGAAESSVLLTLRNAKLKQHSGQYALPGGKLDPEETEIQAAVREVQEEIGVSLADQNLIGVLDDYQTRSGFLITPVVFWIEADTVFTPCADEVEAIFKIPFRELDSEAIPIFEPGVDVDRPVLLSNFPTLGHKMYSPTASILYQFREVALRGLSTRVAIYDQPGFAWK